MITLEGLFGFSIRFISVLKVSAPRNSLFTEKEVIYGIFETDSETKEADSAEDKKDETETLQPDKD